MFKADSQKKPKKLTHSKYVQFQKNKKKNDARFLKKMLNYQMYN